MIRARRSLLWTIAGAFLLAVVVGTLAQALVAVAVLRPLENREARARAELVASAVATEIAAAPVPPVGVTLDTLLARQRARLGGRRAWIAFRGADGAVVTSPARREEWAAGLPPTPTDSSFERRVTRRAPDAPGPPSTFEELVVRRGVSRDGRLFGEVLVVRPSFARGGFALNSPATLLTLPIALVVALLGGLIVVRLLVRRLRRIETLAARVTEGDLDVRIADHSGDEIGQLAERLDRMAERLAEAREQLTANDRQRRQLFADITHELATPLTSIRGYAETMLDPAVPLSPDDRARYVRGVLDESRRLDRLIRDLFELARLEAGAAALAREPLDWAALCRHTVERFAPRFHDAGLGLAFRDATDGAWIDADGHRMERVLDNLLANALRYVPTGGKVEVALADANEGTWRLTVTDDGPGIDAAELPLVFQRFYRGDSAAGDDRGSGLGLAIAREIVERHGGRIAASSRAPRGLVISIELPASPSPSPSGRSTTL